MMRTGGRPPKGFHKQRETFKREKVAEVAEATRAAIKRAGVAAKAAKAAAKKAQFQAARAMEFAAEAERLLGGQHLLPKPDEKAAEEKCSEFCSVFQRPAYLFWTKVAPCPAACTYTSWASSCPLARRGRTMGACRVRRGVVQWVLEEGISGRKKGGRGIKKEKGLGEKSRLFPSIVGV